jgi:photosystem II stability/assembly factor-like uncharacterized protein
VFAATSQGVFRSVNNGESWTPIDKGLLVDVASLAINASGHVFAATYTGVFRSTDNGETWTPVNTGLPTWSAGGNTYRLTVSSIAIDKDGHLFVAGQYSAAGTGGTMRTLYGVFRSSDNGEHWSAVKGTLPDNVARFFVAIDASGHVFVAANFVGRPFGVFRSSDEGDSWREVLTGAGFASITSFVINPNGDVFVAAHGPGTVTVVRSTDSGDRWTPLGWTVESVGLSALVTGENGVIFAVAREALADRIFRSTDGGNSWTPVNTGLPDPVLHGSVEVRVTALAINADGHVFAGTSDDGVFRSTNGGGTWNAANAGLTDRIHFLPFTSLAINANGDIFAGTSGGVYRSTDNGESWERAGAGGLPDYASVSSVAVGAPGEVFAASDDQGIFRSTDSGSTWNRIDVSEAIRNVATLAISPRGDVFAGMHLSGHGRVFRLGTKGGTWTSVDNPLPADSTGYVGSISSLVINARGHVFAGGQRGVFRSTTNGDSWRLIELPNRAEVGGLAINGREHLFATTSRGVFRSVNSGNSWTPVNKGLVVDVVSLAINASGHVFAGGSLPMVFRSTDNGESWAMTNAGKPIPYLNPRSAGISGGSTLLALPVTALAINGDGHVFAGTLQGAFRSTDNGESWTAINTGLAIP